MKELNELVELAKKADREVTWSLLPFDLAKDDWCVEVVDYIASMSPYTIRAIAEAFRALEQRAEAAEAKVKEIEQEQAEHNHQIATLQGKFDLALAGLRSKTSRCDKVEGKLAELEKREPIAWIFEDELPENYPYDEMYEYSKVDVVRMFPVFGPAPAINLAELVPDEMTLDSDTGAVTETGHVQAVKWWNACCAAMLRNIEEHSK